MLKILNNLKIQKKLLVGYGSVIILTIVLAIVSLVTMSKIDQTYSTLLEGSVKGGDLSLEIGREFARARRFLLLAAYSADDATAYKNAINDFNTTVDKISGLTKQTVGILEGDKTISKEENNNALGVLKELSSSITEEYGGYAKKMDTAVQNGQLSGLKGIIDEAAPVADKINQMLDDFISGAQETTGIVSKEATAGTYRDILIVTLIAIFSVIASIVSAILIGRAIRKPIVTLAAAAQEIANGSLDTPVRSNASDEIGILSNTFGDVVDMFSLLVDRINLSYSKLLDGELDVAIDESVFPGGYKKAATAVNNTVNYLAGNTFSAIKCAEAYAKGNFDATLKKFPGPQAILNETFDMLQNNLKSISQDLNRLIENTVAGNLTIKIDSSRYEGDWMKIAKGLNNLLEAVETPISEVSGVLEQVAAGSFAVKVQGDYKGEFNLMKTAVNKTVTNTNEYIKDISDNLVKMSNQNLDVAITKEYIGDFSTIKDALIQIVNTFNVLISDFNSSAEQVAAGAAQMSESSMTLSQGATEQASALEELVATIATISKQTSDNAEHSKKANTLSVSTKNDGIAGKGEMEEMLTSMSDIEEASANISKIIKVIDDIAFQTNLLALNAAVEAARAGEHGKGFAVVAEEVRSLAGRSQKAAAETTELISTTIQIVSNGTRIAHSTANSLNKMVEQITDIAILIDGVSTASNEQDIAIQQIGEGIGQISEITQVNTSTSEETASLAQQLSSQAEVFRNALSQFKLKNSSN